MTLEDAPAGWKIAPPDEEDDVDFEFTGECADFNEDDPALGELVYAESDDLNGPDDQSASSDATVSESEEAARDAVDSGFDAIFGSCRGQLKDLYVQAFRQGVAEEGGDPAAVDVEVLLQDASVPQLGDETRAVRFKINATAPELPFSLSLLFDLVVVREGAMVGGLSYFAVEPDDANRDAMLATIARKLAEAGAGLPGRSRQPAHASPSSARLARSPATRACAAARRSRCLCHPSAAICVSFAQMIHELIA